MDDVLGAVEEKAASSLTTFARQHVLAEIVTNIGAGTSYWTLFANDHLLSVVCLSVSHSL